MSFQPYSQRLGSKLVSLLALIILIVMDTAPAITNAASSSNNQSNVNFAAANAVANNARADATDVAVNTLFNRLSTEQRVGQLLLVTFKGSDLSAGSNIAKLIQQYRIGGVLLQASNDNINVQGDTVANVQALANQIQQLGYNTTFTETGRQTGAFVPLFVATSHEGDMLPGVQVFSGTTPLPSNMAIGATWQPSYAHMVGNIAGHELEGMGINLLFGPSLDVLASPSNDNINSVSTRSFGGEPWWVGQMGAAYISGLHEGSQNGLIVVPRDFPGLGSSDRRPDVEIPVVPRTIDEFSRIDLVPFFAVTGRSTDPLQTADGIQCASLRYQGQNIRAVTRPTCVDEQALGDLLRLDEIKPWRDAGGIIVSDALGTRALRRWYNTSPFPHRQAAREALLAGNDVLLLSDFGPNPGDDDFDNITDVADFFASLYRTDPVFRVRADQAIRRILRQKLEAYGSDFSLPNVIHDDASLVGIGKGGTDLYAIARDAVTLIAPSRQRLMSPPTPNSNIVIFTDMRYERQCSQCTDQPIIPLDALKNSMVRLYGPKASGQVAPEKIQSFSFDQLNNYLNLPPNHIVTSEDTTFYSLQSALDGADWIIFSMLDVSPDIPASNVMQKFLEARLDLVNKTKIVALAFGAPSYLSATDISKLAAYYGIYSSSPPFIDVAARALFQEISYRGDLPISVPAINYDIFQMTSPLSSQIIRIVQESPTTGNATQRTTIPNVLPTTAVGDTLLLRTDPILDHNGHTVPDGTPVVFTLSFVTEGVQRRQDTTTKDGIARTSFALTRSGQVHITASSGDATTSVTFQITVADNAVAATLQTIEPPTVTMLPATMIPSVMPSNTWTFTPLPTFTNTETKTPTLTATSTPTSTLTTTNTATPQPTPTPLPPASLQLKTTPRDFIESLSGLLLATVLSFALNWTTTRSIERGLRIGFSCTTGGLLGYLYFAFHMPGVALIGSALPFDSALLITFIFAMIGLVVGWLSMYRR